MARIISAGSLILFMISLGLSQVSDPGIFGISEEPERIMFYGISGLLTGLSGLVAVGSGIYLGATRFGGLSGVARFCLMTAMVIFVIAILAMFGVRFL